MVSLDVSLDLGLLRHHFLLSVGWVDLALLDALLGLDDFVELLLLVAQFAALRRDEQVLGGAEVELELLLASGLRSLGPLHLLFLLWLFAHTS